MSKLRRDDNGKLPSFAWPGGYPIFYLADDGECFCPACANGENGSDASETADRGSGWLIVGQDVHYEGEPIVCAHCGASIESAYGIPE